MRTFLIRFNQMFMFVSITPQTLWFIASPNRLLSCNKLVMIYTYFLYAAYNFTDQMFSYLIIQRRFINPFIHLYPSTRMIFFFHNDGLFCELLNYQTVIQTKNSFSKWALSSLDMKTSINHLHFIVESGVPSKQRKLSPFTQVSSYTGCG